MTDHQSLYNAYETNTPMPVEQKPTDSNSGSKSKPTSAKSDLPAAKP